MNVTAYRQCSRSVITCTQTALAAILNRQTVLLAIRGYLRLQTMAGLEKRTPCKPAATPLIQEIVETEPSQKISGASRGHKVTAVTSEHTNWLRITQTQAMKQMSNQMAV